MEHPHGWLSLLPPIVAIALAIATRRVVLSLILGILAGALVTRHGHLGQAIHDTWEIHLWNTLTDPGKLRVFSFTLLMGATIGVISRSGGMHGMIDVVTPLARSRRRGQVTAWLLGHLIFFDDYANTLLLGNTLRPLFDRLRISREKLAYLVDSTSAPVAGLALVSTWIAVEIEFIADGIKNLGPGTQLEAFDLFIASIPYRFYVVMALVLVALISFSGRDFGAMFTAERRRWRATDEEIAQLLNTGRELPAARPHRWFNAVIPIVVILAVVIWLILSTGRAASIAEAGPDALRDTLSWEQIRQIVGKGDSSLALQYGALSGLLVAGGLALFQKLLNFEQVTAAAAHGSRLVIPALLILWTASSLSRMTGRDAYDGREDPAPYAFADHRLYTGDYLQQVIVGDDASVAEAAASKSSRVPPWLLPTVVFSLSAAVAFCTGTSWGTMGILMPMVVTLSYAIVVAGGDTAGSVNPAFLCCIGGVLAGSVFGDHCSPLSDTTVLSSQSSGCDHIAHVWTQMPYAVVVAAVNIVLGTLPIGWGVSVWPLLLLQVVALVVILFVVGRRPDRDS